MKRSIILSALLHLTLFFIIFVGFPHFIDERVLQNEVITVEVLPISEFTNVKPKKANKPKEKKLEKKELTKEKPKPSLKEPKKPEVKQANLEPLPKKEQVEKKPDEKPEPEKQAKPEPKKPDEPKKEQPDESKDNFASVLKTVEKLKPAEEPEKKEEEQDDFSEVEDFLAKSDDNTYDESLPLTINEKDAIKQQIMENWTVIAGAKEAEDLIVILNITLAQDGTVTDVSYENKLRYATDNFYRAAVDSAIRAAYKSSPLHDLPEDKYSGKNGWNEVEITFDPSEMLY